MTAGKTTANKMQPTAASVAAFLSAVTPEVRRQDALRLCDMLARLSGEPATMWGPTIVGFGTHHYRYESGREGDMPLIAFSPRKPAMVLYLHGDFPGRADLIANLGAGAAKGCIYIKRLADVDAGVLETAIERSLAYLSGR